jgi:flagellar hook-associated protein 1
MSSPFASLNTALSALRYQQASLDIASTNIANSSTEGYVRRRIVGQTVGAAAVPAVWSRSNEIGSGVESTGVRRLVDPLLDTRVRREHAKQSYLELKAAALARVETGIAEPSTTGVAAAIDTFQNSLDDVNNAPNTDAARSQVLENGKLVADAFKIQANNLQDEIGDQRARVLASVQEINDVAQQLAATNLTISTSSGGGSDTATLMDARDHLTLRLSELTGGTATVRPDGGMDVTVGGQVLVSGRNASVLSVASGIDPDGSGDGSPITFQVQPPAGPAVGVAIGGGEVAASAELIDVTLPDYAAGLNALVKSLADDFNAAHAGGFDLDGNPGGTFFTYDPADPARTLTVAITSAREIAMSAVPTVAPATGGNTDTGNAVVLADSITIQDGYQRLVNSFGSSVASVRRLADNQAAMTSQVDAAREQLTGVSIDEETINMVTAQRSYEAAARVMTTIDQILDTLINRTGIVGR